jgi:hypothetical protein
MERFGGTIQGDRVEALNGDGSRHAVHAVQSVSSGIGAAVHASSANSSSPSLLVDGAGDLIQAKNSAGTLKFKVDNSGNATVAGSATVQGGMAVSGGTGLTGSKAWLYQYLEPAGALASSVDGRMSATSTSATLTSGTVYAFAMPAESGLTISNLTLVSLTAEATGTHAWAGLADNTGTVLAISLDKTGAAYFAANTAITTGITIDGTNPLVTARTGLYYAFVCVVASGTMPTFASAPAFTHVAIATVAPIICGTTLTSQTTPVAVGSSLGTITPTAGHQIYAYCT